MDETPAEFVELLSLPGNDVCFDCGSSSPTWASVSNGVFLCLTCSGIHREIGSHVSVVRSIRMDPWNSNQLLFMKLGGNDKLKNFFKAYEITDLPPEKLYKTVAASHYRFSLKAQVEGKPIPNPIPQEIASRICTEEQLLGASGRPLTPKAQDQPDQPNGKNANLGDQIIGGIGTLLTGLSVSAGNIASTIQDPEFSQQVKSSLTTSKDWIEDKAKNIKTNAQNPEFWQSSQKKIKQGALNVLSHLETGFSGASEWVGRNILKNKKSSEGFSQQGRNGGSTSCYNWQEPSH